MERQKFRDATFVCRRPVLSRGEDDLTWLCSYLGAWGISIEDNVWLHKTGIWLPLLNLMEGLFPSWIKSGDRSSGLLLLLFLLRHPWLSFPCLTHGSKMAVHLLFSCLHSDKKKAEGIRKKEWHLYLERINFSKLSSRLWLIYHWPKWCYGELLKRKKHGKWILSMQLCSTILPLDPLFNILHPFCPGNWPVWIASLSSWGFGFQFGLANGRPDRRLEGMRRGG